MRLLPILSKIKQIQPENLPGFAAQAKMSPPLRREFEKKELKKLNAKESAVMLLLYEYAEETYLVFTQRHVYAGAHSGQISLPGGKRDIEDKELIFTSLRESFEEVGAVIPPENVVNELTWLYVPPSNFVIYPFISFLKERPNFIKQESEVKEILEFRIKDLLNKNNQKKYLYKDKKRNISFESPSYEIEGKVIWGATAMILSEFLSIIEA